MSEMSDMSETNGKIPAVLYSERIVYISAWGPPTVRNLWVPSYNIIISGGGNVYKTSKKPYQTIDEQQAFIEEHQLSNGKITDPQVCEIQIEKEPVEEACKILAEKERLEALTEQNNEKMAKLLHILSEKNIIKET